MNDNKNIPNNYDTRLKNFSEAFGFRRLSDKDYETVSSLTAGGDEAYLTRDINDSSESSQKDTNSQL